MSTLQERSGDADEEGGFGADSAAPAVLEMMETYFRKQASAVSTVGGAE